MKIPKESQLKTLLKNIYKALVPPKSPFGQKPSGLPTKFLVELATSNIRVKKSRTLVTVGGVALAIGIIVLLVSFGFGLQKLVLDRAVKLEEMRQTDVTTQPGSRLRLNQESANQFKTIPDVEKVLPVIAVVGKVSFQSSSSDIAVYGVTSDYLINSATIFTEGKVFDSNNTAYEIPTEGALDIPLTQEVIVNEALLELIGINNRQAVNNKIQIQITVPTELLSDNQDAITSDLTTYSVVGVVNDSEAPIAYVPFISVRALGVENYSQIKVIANNQSALTNIRASIEALGYTTASVVDTVEQINSIFSTFRILLFAFGLVALAVAALGMFNTLTVSLLERTREIGLMKALGMRSTEIRVLFLLESVIMGVTGGLGGLALGMLAGKAIDIFLSILSVSRSSDPLSISYIPLGLVGFISLLSVIIGLITGIYPAARATKISALDALRYE